MMEQVEFNHLPEDAGITTKNNKGMNKKYTQEEILPEVILGYRAVIKDRYQFDALHKKYDLPPFFTEARMNLFRAYFLDYIYPPPAKRVELDEAFQSLDGYIQQPAKLLRILLDSGRLIFKYGRHLPKILSAGLKALRSFRTATQFENKLVQQAIKSKLPPPYSITTINNFTKALPKTDLENFIDSSQNLFETLHDRVLVKKIIEIVEYLIAKMKKRPTVYTAVEIRGLEIGRDIIKNGDLLFDQLPKKGQQQLFDLVIRLEREVLEELFS